MDATLDGPAPKSGSPSAPAGPPGDGNAPRGIVREVAHRLFAQEFNASRVELKGQGEKDPSYVVSPLGAKINRLHIVGVCTDVEPVGQSGELWRARISDPSGVFTVYAGNYQPEAAQRLSQLQVPAFVAVTGKARTYEPEPGSVFVSIRPESITLVGKDERDQWLVDTARCTLERLGVARKARDGTTAQQLQTSGVSKALAEGAALASEKYGLTDIDRFGVTVRTCLGPLVSGGEVPVVREARSNGPGGMGSGAQQSMAPMPAPQPMATPAPTPAAWKAPTPAPAASNAAQDALDAEVLAAVQKLEGAKGAPWDGVLNACSKPGITAEDVEESLNRLMDKGMVYEPTLGVLKTT
jgi:hypothetical protein